MIIEELMMMMDEWRRDDLSSILLKCPLACVYMWVYAQLMNALSNKTRVEQIATFYSMYGWVTLIHLNKVGRDVFIGMLVASHHRFIFLLALLRYIYIHIDCSDSYWIWEILRLLLHCLPIEKIGMQEQLMFLYIIYIVGY